MWVVPLARSCDRRYAILTDDRAILTDDMITDILISNNYLHLRCKTEVQGRSTRRPYYTWKLVLPHIQTFSHAQLKNMGRLTCCVGHGNTLSQFMLQWLLGVVCMTTLSHMYLIRSLLYTCYKSKWSQIANLYSLLSLAFTHCLTIRLYMNR